MAVQPYTRVIQTPSTEGRTDISGLLQSMTGERSQLYKGGLDILQQIAAMMQGPEFDKYAEEMYESAKRKAVGAGTSRLISSGLMGTTRAVEPEQSFEREVGTPFRLGLAEQKTGRIASALGNIANYMQGFAPSAGTLAYLATGGFGQLSPEQKLAAQELPSLLQAAQRSGGGTTGWGGGGGGGTTSAFTPTGGYQQPYSGGTTGAQIGVQRYTGVETPTGGAWQPQEGESWYGPNAPGGTGGATYAGGQWVPEDLSYLKGAAQGEPATFAGGGGGEFGGYGYTGGWEEPTGTVSKTMTWTDPTTGRLGGASAPTAGTQLAEDPILRAYLASKGLPYKPGVATPEIMQGYETYKRNWRPII